MKLFRIIKHLKIVPRWLILVLDICISILSFTLAYSLLHNFDVTNFSLHQFSIQFYIFLLATITSFLTFKIHYGIVRYTSAVDSIRILSTILFITIIIFIIKLFSYLLHFESNIELKMIIVYCLFLFASLIIYRTSIKIFFQYSNTIKKERKNVLIYGAGELGLTVKRTYDNELISNKNIVAYVDDDISKIGKSIDGIKIIDIETLNKTLNQLSIDELIFAKPSIIPDKKADIIDLCLEHDVNVLTVPSINKIINKGLSVDNIKKVKIEDLLDRSPISINNNNVLNDLKGKRILVTGAAGSIGSEIAKQLSKFSPQIIILCDQAESPLHNLQLDLQETFKNQIYHSFIADVTDKTRTRHLFETFKPHIVYHAAAYKHVPMMENHPSEGIKTNVLGTMVVSNLAVEFNVQKFVFVSTDKAVNPTNVMGASKRIAEIYVQALNNKLQTNSESPKTKFITTRFGNVLGSNGSVIPRFKQQIEKGGPVTVTHRDITRYFMTIPEACQLVLEAGGMGQGGEIFVFDMGKAVKIVNLAEKMIKLSGYKPYEEIDILFTGLRPGEKLYEELLNDLENTMPTHHEKIMIAKVRFNDFEKVTISINKLISKLETQNNTKIVKQMKSIVPEFISKNSEYERLDNE